MGHEFEALSGRIIEAAIDVHKALGPGFLESIYENALKVAMARRGIPFASHSEVRVFYEGESVGEHRLDLVVDGEIVVELKAIKALEDVHFAQVRSCLKASRLRVGLLMNFNAPTLVVKRLVIVRAGWGSRKHESTKGRVRVFFSAGGDSPRFSVKTDSVGDEVLHAGSVEELAELGGTPGQPFTNRRNNPTHYLLPPFVPSCFRDPIIFIIQSSS